MKRLQVQDGKSCDAIAQAFNLEQPSDRLCMARGIQRCLKRISQPAAKRIYTRKLGPDTLSFIDAEVNEDRRSVNASCNDVCRKAPHHCIHHSDQLRKT